MGIGAQNEFKSNSIEYSTPLVLVRPLIQEFDLIWDVCASKLNHKCPKYWTKHDDALPRYWFGNCWMNPPFCSDIGKWVLKAHKESKLRGGTKVCLIPVRSNTKWWAEVCVDAEIRFINGEVNFNEALRGVWLPICILIFGEQAKVGTFSVINYRTRK